MPVVANAKTMLIKDSLTNPLRKPQDEQFFVTFDGNYYLRSYNLENNTTNAKISDNKVEGFRAAEGFMYGINDKLSLNFDISYNFYEDNHTLTDQTTDKYDYMGFENPKIGLEYRLMNNGIGRFDLGLSVSPDIVDKKTSTSHVYTGSTSSGRNEFELLARYGKAFNHFVFANIIKITYLGTSEYTELNTHHLYREGDRMKYEFALETEYRIFRSISAGTNIGYIVNTESDLENRNTQVVQRMQPGNILYVHAQLNIPTTKNFTISPYYEYQNIEETYLKYKSGVATVDTVREDDCNSIYGLKTIFRF